MFPQQLSIESLRSRRKAHTRRNWSKVEQYLTEVEKVEGNARSWELRERFEQGDVTLTELGQR
jgi:hypothetical protein